MKKKQAQEEESGEKAPLWIISFADMISLLMAFFVMLQTLATEHTNEMFTTGRGAFEATMGEFRRNIDYFGIPGLFGASTENHSFRANRKKHYFNSPQTGPVTDPAADGDQEKLKRLFTGLAQSAQTDRPQVTGKIQDYTFIPVQFTIDGNQLDSETTARLTQYVSAFEHTGTSSDTVLYYVVGAAPDVSSPSEQWIVSEQRARSVAEFLRTALPEALRENIYWWGAGAGGSWFTSTDSMKNQNHVLIVTLTPSKP
jgi:outer membrane protein OmpA-like peptidoglycan-associated protein